jgi:transposase InsO family protein
MQGHIPMRGPQRERDVAAHLLVHKSTASKPIRLRLSAQLNFRFRCYSTPDFVSDALFDGKRFRALTVVDAYTRECLAIEVDQGLKGDAVLGVMERLAY